MDDPAYQDVLQALNTLISEKPKAGDRQAYAAAYQSMSTYLEVLNLMLSVRAAAQCAFRAAITFEITTMSPTHAEIEPSDRTDQAESDPCGRHQGQGIFKLLSHKHVIVSEDADSACSGCQHHTALFSGLYMCNDREHAAKMRIQDRLVYLPSPCGCQRAHKASRVCADLAVTHRMCVRGHHI